MGRHRHRDDQRQGRALISDEIDSLFEAPPTGFIAERKRIVTALKGAGRKDEAKAIEKIPRPSLAIWTVNQIARRDPEVVRRLGALTERLKGSAGAEYGAAAAELRQVLDELRGEAAAVLAAAGHDDPGPHMVQRVIANMRAAAGSAETRAALERGRLERDVEEQDLSSLFGAALAEGASAAATPARSAGKETKATATAKVDAKSAAELKAQEKARAKEIAAAEREVKRLRDAATAARKETERAERAVAAAQEKLAEAEKTLAAEREARDAAAQELAEAEAALAGLKQD